MLAEERSDLLPELLHGQLRCDTEEVDDALIAELVREIRVQHFAAVLFDEPNQRTELLADVLEHREGDILPPLVGLDVPNQGQLNTHHRDGALLLQLSSDLDQAVPQPTERRFMAQQR